MLPGRGLCDRLVPRTEESECGGSECDREASTMRRPRPTRTVEPLEKESSCYLQTVLNETVTDFLHIVKFDFISDFDTMPCSCVSLSLSCLVSGQSVCDIVSKTRQYGRFS